VRLLAFYRSTIGKKIIMGVTGLIGIGFVILHMAGNLQVFAGQQKINDYGAMLHGPLNELLWVLRVVLIVAVILHVLMAYQLTRLSQAARADAVERFARGPMITRYERYYEKILSSSSSRP